MAAVYSDRGFGVRAPVVFYNRSNEAAGRLKPGDFDWAAIFSRGVKWVHSGGIFAALSPTTAPLAAEMMKAAKAAGAITSFDLNFREKLWKIHGGNERAVETISSIVQNVDILVGNEEDLQKGLGIAGPDVKAKSKLDPSVFLGMIDSVVRKHPHVKAVATTLREVHSTSHHSWSAVAWIDGQTYSAPTVELEVLDRVGGGTDLLPASSTVCSWASRLSAPSSWAGRTAHCSPLFPETPRWPPSNRSAHSPPGAQPAFSADRGPAAGSKHASLSYCLGKSRGFQLSSPRRYTSGRYCRACSAVRKWVCGSRWSWCAPGPAEPYSA